MLPIYDDIEGAEDDDEDDEDAALARYLTGYEEDSDQTVRRDIFLALDSVVFDSAFWFQRK